MIELCQRRSRVVASNHSGRLRQHQSHTAQSRSALRVSAAISFSYQCLPSHQLRPYWKRPIRKQAHLPAGSLLPLPSSRRQGTCISRQQTRSNSRSSSEKQGMHFPRRQSAERNVKRRMMPLMLGGMPRRPTREASPIVR